MSNNEYKDGDLDAFRKEYGGVVTGYDEQNWGIEFSFRGKFYRMTLDQSGDDEFVGKLKDRFNKSIGRYEVFSLPIKSYPGHYELTENLYIGLYDDIDDLLENCEIEGMKFKDIIVSSETEILGKD